MKISTLIPAGCRVEVFGEAATVNGPNGDFVAILCSQKNNVELARLIAGLPALLAAIEVALDHGLMLPIVLGANGLEEFVFTPSEAAAFPPTLLPA